MSDIVIDFLWFLARSFVYNLAILVIIIRIAIPVLLVILLIKLIKRIDKK